jgi:pectin methylesterase-like acyl-CoA thioesterase
MAITLARLNNNDETFATIQEAIDAAVDGDTILLDAGEYVGNLLINKISVSLAPTMARAGPARDKPRQRSGARSSFSPMS